MNYVIHAFYSQTIEVDNKTKLAFTRHDPIGVCGQMYVLLTFAPLSSQYLQYSMELPDQYVVCLSLYIGGGSSIS